MRLTRSQDSLESFHWIEKKLIVNIFDFNLLFVFKLKILNEIENIFECIRFFKR